MKADTRAYYPHKRVDLVPRQTRRVTVEEGKVYSGYQTALTLVHPLVHPLVQSVDGG